MMLKQLRKEQQTLVNLIECFIAEKKLYNSLYERYRGRKWKLYGQPNGT